MNTAGHRVLIVSNQEANREAVRLLLGSMGCAWILASTMEEALGILKRERAAAAIIDSQLAACDCQRNNEVLREILLRLRGRIILLLGQGDDPKTLEFARAYSLPCIRRDRWAQDLWRSLEALLCPPKMAARIKEVANLVLDTLAHAQPEGVRGDMINARHLLYETKLAYVDVSFELQPDAKSMVVGGQILTKEGKRALQGAAIKILGSEGPLGFGTTNQSGEFLFEIERERKIVLEIEGRPGYCVAIHSPELIWGLRDGSRVGH